MSDIDATPVLTKVDIPVEGMTCASCARRVSVALGKLDGEEGEGRHPMAVQHLLQEVDRLRPCSQGTPPRGLSDRGAEGHRHDAQAPPELVGGPGHWRTARAAADSAGVAG